tara:strand:+ start:576 stop:743 length:168 start_codon:yes stop_codon:yes gene_type:complete
MEQIEKSLNKVIFELRETKKDLLQISEFFVILRGVIMMIVIILLLVLIYYKIGYM